MQNGKLIKADGIWLLQLPIEAAIALGGKEGMGVRLSLTEKGIKAESTSTDKEFLLAAASVFSENRETLRKLSKE